MHVPFIDLQSPTQRIKERYLQALDAFLDRANFILTEEVATFEKQWAAYLGAKFCAGVSSGADALYIALVAAGVKAGDEVITQGNAYNASVTAILRAGAIPRFVDIAPETLTLHVSLIESLITPRTRAIVPVHLFGQSCDMISLEKICKKHGLVIVEDSAQAHGATFADRPLGSWGIANAFSFYPTKNLGAFGDAGSVVTNNKEMYDAVIALRNLGQVEKNDHQYFGTNMRLDPIQAIALSLKLPFLGDEIKQRKASAAYYTKHLESLAPQLSIPYIVEGADHIFHLYVVQSLSMDRDLLRTELAARGVDTAVHYPVPVYKQPFFVRDFSQSVVDACPVADEAASKILSLPLFAGITEVQLDYVVNALREILM